MAFGSTLSEEEAIRYYLNVGYSCNVIAVFLRIQTLKTRLRHDRLRREQIALDENIIRGIIEREIQGHGSIKGYRSMHQNLKQSYGVHVPRDNVMQISKEIDPNGISYPLLS